MQIKVISKLMQGYGGSVGSSALFNPKFWLLNEYIMQNHVRLTFRQKRAFHQTSKETTTTKN